MAIGTLIIFYPAFVIAVVVWFIAGNELWAAIAILATAV